MFHRKKKEAALIQPEKSEYSPARIFLEEVFFPLVERNPSGISFQLLQIRLEQFSQKEGLAEPLATGQITDELSYLLLHPNEGHPSLALKLLRVNAAVVWSRLLIEAIVQAVDQTEFQALSTATTAQIFIKDWLLPMIERHRDDLSVVTHRLLESKLNYFSKLNPMVDWNDVVRELTKLMADPNNLELNREDLFLARRVVRRAIRNIKLNGSNR